MNREVLAEVTFSLLDRGQIRRLVEHLSGEPCRLRKPQAAEELTRLVASAPVAERHRTIWPLLSEHLGDWRDACDALDLPEDEDALRNELIGPPGAQRSPSVIPRRPGSHPRETAGPTLVLGGDDYIDTVVEMVKAAQRRVVLVAFVLGPGFKDVSVALFDAAERGVKIRAVLDGRKGCEEQLGEELAEHDDVSVETGYLHAKCLIVDEHDVLLGSSNMDAGGAPAFQVNVRLRDGKLAKSLVTSLSEIPPVP